MKTREKTMSLASLLLVSLAVTGGMDRSRLNIGAYYLKEYAQTERHVKEAKECGIDFFTCIGSTTNLSEIGILDLFHKYGIGAFVSGVEPSWWAGPTRLYRSIEKECPLRHWVERASRYPYRHHPAVWGLTIGDEPGALTFPHYRKVLARLQEEHPDLIFFLNLLPNVAPKDRPAVPFSDAVAALHKEHPNLAARGPDKTPDDYENLIVLYQARDYEEYISKYCEQVPLDYISYDFYLYKGPDRRIPMSFENMRTVSDACRRTGRDFWSVIQVNSSDKNRLVSVDGLRYQAYQSMAYGATTLIWACYTAGWWHHQVLDEKGEKTPQYEKLKKVNSEIHRIGDTYMRYRNVATHLVGDYEATNVHFRSPEKLLLHTEKTGTQPTVAALNAAWFTNVHASGGEALMVGEMVGRKDMNERALFICAADDPMECAPHEYEVCFNVMPGRRTRAFGTDGELPISSASDGSSRVSIRSNGFVMITSEPRNVADIRGPWKNVPFGETPKSWPAEDVKPEADVKSVWIEGEEFNGKPTRFFAYYGLPKDASPYRKCPAMVLVHGGEGTAFAKWVRLWNERGYAAIAMDTCGAVPVKKDADTKKWKRHEWSGPAGWGNFSSAMDDPRSQWTYHAIAAVIRSHDFLRSLPEVDRYRIGITGISWGGYLTCIAAGVDDRYLFAVPVYGCGFFGEGSRWKTQLEQLGATGRRWLELWDASVYLPNAKCRFYWVSGKDDPFFPYASLKKSASLVKGTSEFHVVDHMVHGQNAGSTPECIRDFTDRLTGHVRPSKCDSPAAPSPHAKYIAFAWEFQNHGPKDFLAVADQFAKSPIDGVGFYLYGRNPDGKAVSSYTICQEPRWERAAFADQIQDFRRLVEKPGFRESFFTSYRAPNKRVDWTDDAGWATIAHNMGVLAAFAKECGVKGLSVDHEDYHRQNQYVRQDGDPPYDECRKLARRRGREVFGAVFREYPEVVILSFWILTEDRTYYTAGNPDAARRAKQDLWPDFVAGILDELPPAARLVEGDEHAYRYEYSSRDFHYAIANSMRMGRTLLPVEVRAKFLSQVEQSFGMYLDAYVNPFDPAKRASWSHGPEGGSRLEHFRRNVAEATSLASEYVWFWGECNPWVTWPEKMRPHRKIRYDRTWNDEIPGLNEMLAVTKAGDAGEWERFNRLSGSGAIKSLIPSGALLRTWQAAKGPYGRPLAQKGTFSQKDGVMAAESVADGCFLFEHGPVEAGERYAFIVKAKGCHCGGEVGWMDSLGVIHGMPRARMSFADADKDGWREGRVIATVPAGAEKLRLTLGLRQKPGERTEYRDLAFYRLYRR